MPPKRKTPSRARDDARSAPSPDSGTPPSCTLAIKAIPNAPRNEIAGWLGDALKVKVHAPPVDGKANDALCEFLAEAFGVPRRAVTLLRGGTSREKVVQVAGLSLDDVKARVGPE